MKLSDEEIELGKKEAAYPTRRLPEVREYFDHSIHKSVGVSQYWNKRCLPTLESILTTALYGYEIVKTAQYVAQRSTNCTHPPPPPPPQWAPVSIVFWAGQPSGPAGWLALLLLKTGDVETNPGLKHTSLDLRYLPQRNQADIA